MKTLVVVLLTAVLTLVLAAGIVWGWATSGAVDIAADRPHSDFVRSFLHEVAESSIESGAARVTAPADLDAAARVARGLEHFHSMCVTCHGAPGLDRGEIGQGLNPEPPELSQEDHTPEVDFWVVKHGIRMTGMPAFGATHDDEAVWDIAAFLQRLSGMDAATYADHVRAAGLELESSGHGHGGDGGGHAHGGGDAADGGEESGDGHQHAAGEDHQH